MNGHFVLGSGTFPHIFDFDMLQWRKFVVIPLLLGAMILRNTTHFLSRDYYFMCKIFLEKLKKYNTSLSAFVVLSKLTCYSFNFSLFL